MSRIYQSPLRVYLCLLALAVWGVVSGLQLPISLFPNSAKPEIYVRLPYGGLTAEQFFETYGRRFESQLKAVSFDSHDVESVAANYDAQRVRYRVIFKWGAPPRDALKEVTTVTNSFGAQLPQEIRDSVQVFENNEGTGFLAISFYSSTRSLDDLYKYLEPIMTPLISKVEDANEAELWNPDQKEVRIELNPEKMALLQIVPEDVSRAVKGALLENSGGSLTVGLNNMTVSMERVLRDVRSLNAVVVQSASGQTVHLGDIAKIDMSSGGQSSRIMKTSGLSSIILFATPRPGGNIKKMSEQIVAAVKGLTLPPDVQYRILVDPSEFIRSAVANVTHEVFLAAFLAVVILFIFIGNLKNVVTAAIEIPMSIIMAFILMKMTGINLNIISLGGLALSAGMNVDASVVVMENIFRYFENAKGPLTAKERLKLVTDAVNEVKFPILASTVASLVVFLPLMLTSGLTNAILGDLAMAVIFSHGLSALVALVLVPTVRLHLMSSGRLQDNHAKSPIEGSLKAIENFYVRLLSLFLRHRTAQLTAYGVLIAGLALLVAVVLPRLPKEIIGRPDTDWIYMNINTQGNKSIRQMEGQTAEIEARLLNKFGEKVQYTFTQISGPGQASVMARLKDKKEMTTMWKAMQNEFTDTPDISFYLEPWNPSELPIPRPPDLRLVVRGSDREQTRLAAKDIRENLQSQHLYSYLNARPHLQQDDGIYLRPNIEQWSQLQLTGSRLTPADIADISRVATTGREIGEMPVDSVRTSIVLNYPEDRLKTVEDLASLPVGVGGKLLPLKALAHVEQDRARMNMYREDGKDLILITGEVKEDEKPLAAERLQKSRGIVDQWLLDNQKTYPGITAFFEDAQVDLNTALHQLGWAVALSIALIFLTMVFQFGDIVNALLVLVAVPLGFIGVLLSLFTFGSTLSLNSALGVILLNGIAVANSIILVDYLKRLVDRGHAPQEAAILAGERRLRPILMTSLTTGLGMLPIALGMGEGGRILQPLGIAVAGGLMFSMIWTLFVVPSLQVSYLQWRIFRQGPPVRPLHPVPLHREPESQQELLN